MDIMMTVAIDELTLTHFQRVQLNINTWMKNEPVEPLDEQEVIKLCVMFTLLSTIDTEQHDRGDLMKTALAVLRPELQTQS